MDTDVDLEWWVWLAGLALGGLFGGIIGVIVAAIVLAITESVLDGVANSLISSGISGSLGSFASIPLGPIGSGLSMSAIVLDDLELRGSIVRMPGVPVRNQGGRYDVVDADVRPRRGIDRTDRPAGHRPRVGPGERAVRQGCGRLTVTGQSFGALTPLQISSFPMGGLSVPLAMIPAKLELPFLTVGGEVVLGMRTGRDGWPRRAPGGT